MTVIDVKDMKEIREVTDCVNITETLFFLRDSIDYLATHNKNYTKKQYHMILEMQDIIHQLYLKEV